MDDFGTRRIVELTETILGKPRRGVNLNGWTEYNCPSCSSHLGMDGDGKFNLCINYKDRTYHCWKCLDRGRLSRLFRKYGGEKLYYEYKREENEIRQSKSFKLNALSANDGLRDDYEEIVDLPKGYNKFDEYGKDTVAYLYLRSRGITDYIIEKYNIGYTKWSNDDYKSRKRIIIPSYNKDNEINYWIARDYTGKSKLKYCNPKVEKKKIIFNEKYINWYADLTLVEGVFDHIVVPNSVPLLGKTLTTDTSLYKAIQNNAMANINILLDDDAIEDAVRLYKFLDVGKLKGRVRLMETPFGYKDPSSIFEKFGRRGIIRLMQRKRILDDYELSLF